MSDNEKEEKQQSGAGAGQLESYTERHVAYKNELAKMLASVPPGLSVGYLIAGLRKKYGLDVESLAPAVVSEPQQGDWSLTEINKRRDERLAKEAEENLKNQEKAQQAKKIKDLKSRLFRAQFHMPRDFSWPEESRDVLRPFEFAKEREIWACFSSLKILLREALVSEFNLCGVEINLVRFMEDARDYQGGEKQLSVDSLSALKTLLRIMLTKSEPAKPALKVEKAAAKAQPKGEHLALSAGKKTGRQLPKPALLKTSTEPAPEEKSEFKSFLWTNKFRRVVGLKPPPFNAELEKAFLQLSLQYQKAIVFRFRIAQPAISLKELIVGGMKRGVEELVKKALEDLRQKVLDIRREEGVFAKSSAPAEPELKLSQPETPAPAIRQNQRRKDMLFSQLVFSPQNIAAWIKKVKEADSADIPNFFREISLEKLNKALLKREIAVEGIGQILPLAEIVKRGITFTLKQARFFLLRFGEVKIPFKIIGEAFGVSPKTARLISEKAINKLVVFLKDCPLVDHDKCPKSLLLGSKELMAKKLELAQDVWTDRMLVSLRSHLGDLADLLVHPEQLAFALNFRNHNKGIAKDVFISAFSRSSVKTVKETAECLGRTQKEVIDAKTKLLRRISRRLQQILPDNQPKEIFSAYLTPGFNPAEYAVLREKEARARKEPKNEKPISQKLLKWLATFGEQRLKRMAMAIIAQLEERG